MWIELEGYSNKEAKDAFLTWVSLGNNWSFEVQNKFLKDFYHNNYSGSCFDFVDGIATNNETGVSYQATIYKDDEGDWYLTTEVSIPRHLRHQQAFKKETFLLLESLERYLQ